MYLMSSEKHSACDTLEAELTDIQAAVASNTHTHSPPWKCPVWNLPSVVPLLVSFSLSSGLDASQLLRKYLHTLLCSVPFSVSLSLSSGIVTSQLLQKYLHALLWKYAKS